MAKLGFNTSVSPDSVQPSAAKAFSRWLFNGADPMDRARMVDMEMETKRRDAAIRQAFLERLAGAVGAQGPAAGVPMRAPEPPPLAELTSSPLESGARQVADGLSRGNFGDDVPVLASKGPRIDMTMPDVPAMRSVGVPMRAGSPPNLRDNLDWIAPGVVLGIPGAEKVADLFDKVGPEYDYVNGVRIDKKDPNSPKEIFDVDKGQRRVYDESGRPIGVMTVDGYVKSVAEIEGAKTGAQESAKAQFDVIEVPLQDGRTLSMPRSEALSALRGQGGGAPGAAGGGAGGLGVKPSAAQTEYDTGKAKTKVEVEALTPKARSSLDALDRKTDFILDTLRRAQGMISGGLGGSAGANEVMKGIPGTKARDLDATLDTVRAALGFQELSDMRQNSPTGGAVGSLTERELGLLSSLMGSLDQGQDPEQLKANITRMVTELDKVTKERRSAFQRQYGAGLNTAPLNTTITPDQARAELARRRAAKGQ